MPKGTNFDGTIEITLQGHQDSMRLHTTVDTSVLSIKEMWRGYAGWFPHFCIFDGFLLEDAATLVGLGVVGGDTILILPEKSPPPGSEMQMLSKISSKRSAEEISVGLNVLFGEEERLEVLSHSTNQHLGPLASERMLMLQTILDDFIEILERHDAQVTGRFDMDKIKEACFNHVYVQGRQLEDRDLVQLLPQEDDDDQIVAEVFGILKHFRDTNWTLPGSGHLDYDMVFIGPERNANFTNYLAFPPTVQLYGLDWRTTLRDLMESYREYSNFNIPDEFDHLWFNNETYFLDERVYDVIINGLSQVPLLPNHQHFCFEFDISATEDLRCIDDLVSFIEGGDEFGNEPKKKKKKKQKKKESSLVHVKEESQALTVEQPLQEHIVEDNSTKESVNDPTGPISSLKEVHKINPTDHKENLMNRVDEKKVKLETLVDVQVSLQTCLNIEKEKLVETEEAEQNLSFLKEKDKNLIMSIDRTDLEISNISNGISSCDSEIHDLEMRLQRVKLLRGKLTDKRNNKFEKLKTLEEEKRQLTQKINTDSLRYHEHRADTLRNIESLSSYLTGTDNEIVEVDLSTDGSSKCPAAVQYLDSEIRKLEVSQIMYNFFLFDFVLPNLSRIRS